MKSKISKTVEDVKKLKEVKIVEGYMNILK